MSGLDQNLSGHVSIDREHWDVPVRVEFRAYLAFIRKMNRQLRKLEKRWQHTASLDARGVRSEFEIKNRISKKNKKPK
jgi:hypothetical protein